jgi:hypothetical protein
MSKNGNKPAFAAATYISSTQQLATQEGLTKREIFAMAAMQGFLSSGKWSGEDETTEKAVLVADKLLKQLEIKSL